MPPATYQALLHYGVEACRRFSVVVRHELELRHSAHRVLISLAPFLRISRESDQWPGTILRGATALVHRGEMNTTALRVLANATDHLYGWAQPDLPEDLCLYRSDDTVFLASVVQDKEAYFCLTPEEHGALRERVPELPLTSNPEVDGMNWPKLR